MPAANIPAADGMFAQGGRVQLSSHSILLLVNTERDAYPSCTRVDIPLTVVETVLQRGRITRRDHCSHVKGRNEIRRTMLVCVF